MSYNGWTNYETWAVNLWLTNDEASQRYWDQAALEAAEEENPVWSLEDRLKAEVTDGAPEDPNLYTDLVSAALDRIDWRELAENMLEGLGEGES